MERGASNLTATSVGRYLAGCDCPKDLLREALSNLRTADQGLHSELQTIRNDPLDLLIRSTRGDPTFVSN